MEQLHFAINGDFVTNIAREKFYIDKDLPRAMDLLRSALVTDQLTYNEITMLILQILNGDAKITGDSDTPDYGVEFDDNVDEKASNLQNVLDTLSQSINDMKTLNEDYNALLQRYLFLCDRMKSYELSMANDDYYSETGEALFPDMPVSRLTKSKFGFDDMDKFSTGSMSPSLQDYVNQRIWEDENPDEAEMDYGWLEPDGTYHPVPWGHHAEWAGDWLNEHKPLREFQELYHMKNSDGSSRMLFNGDVLVHSLHWVLLDSPSCGRAFPTYDAVFGLTKEQKKFLFDYYTARGRSREASALYQDDDN